MSMVDLAFPIVQGSVVPLDHAHLLLGALKGAIPQLAEIRLGVHPLTGDVFPASGLLNLDRRAVLRLRLDDAFIPLAAPLAGRELRIGSMLIRLGRPTVEMLAPRSALHAAMVVVARTVPRAMRGIRPDGRSDRVNRVCTGPELVTYIQSRCNPGASVRIGRWLALRLHNRGPRGTDLRILGAAVTITDLDPATSLRLQVEGLGGRRAFGCGIMTALAIGAELSPLPAHMSGNFPHPAQDTTEPGHG